MTEATRNYMHYEDARDQILPMMSQPRTLGEITTEFAERHGQGPIPVKRMLKKMIDDGLIGFRLVGNVVIYWKEK